MNKLILLRHGQSQWNLENRFTGWKDVPLTAKGINEACLAGKLMKKNNIEIDVVFSSVLVRAIETAKLAILEMNQKHLLNKKNELIMTCNKSLNERDYGDLVGLNKKETAKKFGEKQVHIWRRSYDISPPGGESLKEVVRRVGPYFSRVIESELNKSKNVLVVAHGNSLRAILIKINLYKPEAISKIEIPTGNPLQIKYKNGKLINSEFLF